MNAIISSIIVKENWHAKIMWNGGVERGLFNPNSFSTTREKRYLEGWRCTKSGISWLLSLKDIFFVLLRVARYSTQRPPYHPKIAKDFLVLTVFAVERRTEASRSFNCSFRHFVNVYEFHRFSVSTGKKKASPTKDNKIQLNRFEFYVLAPLTQTIVADLSTVWQLKTWRLQ